MLSDFCDANYLVFIKSSCETIGLVDDGNTAEGMEPECPCDLADASQSVHKFHHDECGCARIHNHILKRST